MIDFDTFTKIVQECGRFRQITQSGHTGHYIPTWRWVVIYNLGKMLAEEKVHDPITATT